MLLDLNFLLKDLEGKEVQGQNLGQLFASVLAGQEKNIPYLKAHDWALKLYNKKPIDIDRSDIELIKNFIKDNQQITVLAKAPIFEALDKLKEEKKEEKNVA